MLCAFYLISTKPLGDALLDYGNRARSRNICFQVSPDIVRSGHKAPRSRMTLNGPGLGYRCCGGYISTSLNPGANPLGRSKMVPLSLWKIEIVCELVAETLFRLISNTSSISSGDGGCKNILVQRDAANRRSIRR